MIDIELNTDTPEIEASLTTENPVIEAEFDTDGIDINNLRIRVTDLENNAVGTINASYDSASSVLSITTENTKGHTIGTARTVNLPAGVSNITYNEQEKKIIVEFTDNTTINVGLQESFDKIDRDIANLQSQINNLDLKKLDKVAYLTSSDIDEYFNE